MNKRIFELADEAAKFSAIMALPAGESGDKLFVEKFAELIVRECIDRINRVGILEDVEQSGMIVQNVREHFGVEE